eukprot:m.122053 g.122053  ORF g.122053 m.122053 type:complete len:658 (-) comp14415_c0_seq3:2294-4267(-)
MFRKIGIRLKPRTLVFTKGMATQTQGVVKEFDWRKHQKPLQHVPLPALADTLQRYLVCVKALATPAEFERTSHFVHTFQETSGKLLQNILTNRNELIQERRDLGDATSYVRPFWDFMYLGGRYPVPINSNPVFIVNDLPDKATHGQAGAASALSFAMIQWFLGMKQNKIEPDYVDAKKTTASCMEEYSFLFGETRVPRYRGDEITVDNSSKHIAVLKGSSVYSVTVTDGLNSCIAKEELRKVLEEISSCSDAGNSSEFVGILGSQERNWWAAERAELEAHHENRALLDTIDNALFLVVLDDVDPQDISQQMAWGLHGSGTSRWWDKNFSVIASKSGKIALNFEHAPYDGSTVARLLEDCWHEASGLPLPAGRPSLQELGLDIGSIKPDTTKHQFYISPRTKSAVEHANKKYSSFTDVTKVHVLEFNHFGKNTLKSWKMSPDGVIQAAFQLAYARLHGQDAVSVYESCSTKRYLRGRTEAIRPVSLESRQFVTMADSCPKDKSRSLLEASAARHRVLASEASQGLGVDRHLFALLSIATDLGITDKIELFQDPIWTRFNTSILSTSNVNGGSIHAFGFGAVCPQGYGLGYCVKDDALRITVSNFVGEPDTGGSGFGGVSVDNSQGSTQPTNCHQMATMIEQTLLDIQKIAKSSVQSSL